MGLQFPIRPSGVASQMNNIIQKRLHGKQMYVRIKVLSQSDLDAQAAFKAFRMGD